MINDLTTLWQRAEMFMIDRRLGTQRDINNTMQ